MKNKFKNTQILLIIFILLLPVTAGCKQKPVKLTVEIFERNAYEGPATAHDNAWTRWIQKKVKEDLNIEVSFVPVNYNSEHIDIANLIKSGNAPDLCYTNDAFLISVLRDQGDILDLRPYIDEYLPDLKILLGDFIYRNEDPKTDSIYSISSYRTSLAKRNVFMRKDWLDKLGLPIPKTIEEFYRALVGFGYRDPGNVGLNKVIPFGLTSDVLWGLAAPIQHFSNDMMMPDYKEGILEMNKWYNEGLIYRDFPLLNDFGEFYNLIKSGVVGAFCQEWDLIYRSDYKILEELKANVPDAEFIAVDCFNNKKMYDKAYLQIFIPKTAEAKNTHIPALQYLNWLSKPENLTFLQIGHEGVNHILVDGIPKIKELPLDDEWFQNSAYNIDITMPVCGVETGFPEMNARILSQSYNNIPDEVIIEAYAVSVRSASSVISRNNINFKGKFNEFLTQAITAKPDDFNAIWDNGIQLTTGY